VKVHLIDGTYELFRAYYGAPSKLSPSGKEVGATISFGRSLAHLLRTPGVTHVAVAFDTVIESFRNDLFDGYKTGEGIEPELWEQFPLVEKLTAALGVVVWSMIEFEADDALATAAQRWQDHEGVEQMVICSPDKDFAQCVNKHTVMWDRLRNRIIDADGVKDKFGVLPESIPDWLALVGDTADGIPGIPRWGAKSAAQVLAKFHHIEQIPLDAEKWSMKVRGMDTLVESLKVHKKEVLLYRKLATLRRDVPLKESLHDLQWRGGSASSLNSLEKELGFKGFLS